jgi:hypothetical protein
LLENYTAILANMSEKIKAIHGDVEAADFVQRAARGGSRAAAQTSC